MKTVRFKMIKFLFVLLFFMLNLSLLAQIGEEVTLFSSIEESSLTNEQIIIVN